MPYKTVPVVHKFGIISASQRLELQERLLKQTYIKNNVGKKTSSTQRNDLQVSEYFISCFNNAESFTEKEKYEEKARKMLERSKRRSGLKTCGKGNHTNVALAWTEMAQLAQCKGRIQDECLDALIVSLDVSPLEKYHIPALFYLAETVLYWLRTDSIHQPFLRTSEVKLLKMGQLVFERLFYHHMAGQLQVYGESKNRLVTYIEGLQDCQQLYDPYPNALLSLQFVIEVGKIILADMTSATTEIIDGSKSPSAPNKEEINQSSKGWTEKQSHEEGRSVWSAAISTSVHDLSPTLWHALDVWRCTNGISGGHQDALRALAHCGLGLANETWVDGIVAIQILGNAATSDLAALEVLFQLARGLKDEGATTMTTELSEHRTTESELNRKSHHDSSQVNSNLSPSSSLSDIDEEGEPNSTTKSSTLPKSGEKQVDLDLVNEKDLQNEEKNAKSKLKLEFQKDTTEASKEREEANMPSWQETELLGIVVWRWEVAVTYVQVLADIVLNGTSAAIQKHATMGANEDISEIIYRGVKNIPFQSPCHSAGLLDLVFFRSVINGVELDWSWRVRFEAIQALTRISHSLAGDPLKEGLTTTVRNVLLKANAAEKDLRVLEALKIGLIHTDTRKFVDIGPGERRPSLGNQIASCLSSIYLPPIPPPVAETFARQPTNEGQGQAKQTTQFEKKETQPLRTTIKQEIQLASPFHDRIPDYNTRKSFDLRRIVEDQWRKELQASLADAEEEELKILVENQKNEEIRQNKVAAAKVEKLNKKVKQLT